MRAFLFIFIAISLADIAIAQDARDAFFSDAEKAVMNARINRALKKAQPTAPVKTEATKTVNDEKVMAATAIKVAPVSVVVPYTAYPIKKEENKAKHSFEEFTLYAGGWYAMKAQSKGVWAQGEWTHWVSLLDRPENFGAGLIAKYDHGRSKDGYKWGYFAPGLNLDYYRTITEADDFLAKFRPMYRIGEGNSRSGFMPGVYLQEAHVLDRNNKLIFTVDGQYFPNDSYLGIGVMLEHRFNKDFKVRIGPVLGVNFLQDLTVIGIGPEIVFDAYNRFEIGLSANFAKGGPFLGAFVGYKFNSDLRLIDSALRERSVKIISGEETPIAKAEEVKVKITEDGNYTTLPMQASGISLSTKTLDESN